MAGLLDQLQDQLSLAGDTRVIASYAHPKLSIEPAGNLRVFVPDLHLLSTAARDHNGFSGPAPSHGLLRRVLEGLVSLRGAVARDNPQGTCQVYFMGDALDLWREAGLGADVSTMVKGITAEHRELFELACSPALQAHFLLGNHDFKLYEAPPFRNSDRRHFFPEAEPKAVALHGDVFDWVEQFPDVFNEVVVYYLQSACNHLDDIYDRVKRMLHEGNATSAHATAGAAAAAAAAAGANDAVVSCGALDEAKRRHRLFGRAWEACEKTREDCGLDLRCVVIGHTHDAGIVAYESGQEFLTLIDAGGWIQDACDMHGGKESGTLAAMCDGEARIFQVRESGA